MTETLPTGSADAPAEAAPRPSDDRGLPDGPGASPSRPGGPRLPDILGPWETAVAGWRWLRRMSTALLLLFALAVASVVGTFVPQEPVIPQTVAEWRDGTAGPGAEVARALDAANAFDLFGSWWFLGLTALLFVSLTGCLVPRIRAFWLTARRRPPAGRHLHRLTSSVAIDTDRDPAEAARLAADVLRRARFRVRMVDDTAVAAERGHLREGGSLLFHLAFYVLLVGVLIGNGFGFTGQVNLAEGDPPIVDTRLTYGLATPGRWFGLEDHRGFGIRLDDFRVEWHDDDTPASYRSDITILDGDREVERGAVRVNHPYRYDGMAIYQVRWGLAPRVVVRAGDTVLYDERVSMSPAAGGVWTGVAPLSSRPGNQLALDLALVPDADLAVDADGRARVVTRSPRPENPRVFADLYSGELGLERPVPVSEIDRTGGPTVSDIVLAPGTSQELLDDRLVVELVDVGEWTGFQVSHQPGRWLLVVGAVLALVGLLPSLYAYRRRVWAQASEVGGRTRVRLAGVALQRHDRFAEEHGRLVEQLRAALAR